MMDAFKALKDVSDDIIYTTPKKTGKIGAGKKKLSEAITVDLNSTISKEEADKAVEEATAKVDRPITIVDVNADTLEHVKDKIDYVGQVILKCKKCQGLKFIDMDKLVTSEIDDPNNEGEKIEVYNIEDECPTCHAEQEGFDIVGQVSKVPTEEETVSNDETSVKTETAEKVEETEETEEPAEEETAVEEEESSEETIDNENDVPEDDTVEEVSKEETEEQDFSETDEADDTEDLELPKFTDEEEEVEEDDTETNESLEDGKLRGLLNGLSEADGEIKEEEEEIFDYEKPIEIDTSEYGTVEDYIEENKEEHKGFNTLNGLLSLMVNPEDVEYCEIYDINGKLIYRGTCEEVPESLKEEEFESYHTAGKMLPLNVATEDAGEEDVKLLDVLAPFCDLKNKIVNIVDQEEDGEIFHGTADDALEQFKDKKFISMEAPEILVLNMKEESEDEEIKTEVSEKDELLHEILNTNNLSKYNLMDKTSLESWINESLIGKEHEDLENVYSSFIRPTHNKGLIEKFKSFTGYRDALDIIKEDFSDILTEEKEEEKPVGKFANSDELLQAYLKLQADFEEKTKKLKEFEDNKQPVEEATKPAGIRKLKRMLNLNIQNESKGDDIMSVEDFLYWHDHEVDPGKQFPVLEKIYNIFEKNGFSVDDNVDDCYYGIPNSDKAIVTELVKEAKKLTEAAEKKLEEDKEPTGIIKLKRMYDLNIQTESKEEDTDKVNIQEGENNNRPLKEEEEALEFVRVKDEDYFFDDETGLVHLSDNFGLEKVGDYINLKFVDDDDENIYTYKVIEKKEDEPRLPWTLEWISEQTNFIDDNKIGIDEEAGDDKVDETLHDRSREDEEEEKKYINRISERSVAIEEIKKLAHEDLEKDTIKDFNEFKETVVERGIDSSFADELYDFYLEGIGYIEESLTEAVDESHKFNPDDTITIKINGEVVSTDLVKNTFKDDKSLDEFYAKFVVQNGVYVAQEGDEKWEVTLDKKADIEDKGNVETKEETTEEETTTVEEQLKRETDPEKVAELKAERAEAEADMDYCDDHNDPRGAINAAKEIDRIDEKMSFKTRKELAEAIEKCKAENKKYKISRSKNEGYRYDLILIPVEDEEVPEEHVCPICGRVVGDGCCCADFDTDAFVSDMNDYFGTAYDEPVLLTVNEGSTDNEGNVLLEGTVKSGEKETPVKFLLKPDRKLTEGVDKKEIIYKVTNNLSDETFEFQFNK